MNKRDKTNEYNPGKTITCFVEEIICLSTFVYRTDRNLVCFFSYLKIYTIYTYLTLPLLPLSYSLSLSLSLFHSLYCSLLYILIITQERNIKTQSLIFKKVGIVYCNYFTHVFGYMYKCVIVCWCENISWFRCVYCLWCSLLCFVTVTVAFVLCAVCLYYVLQLVQQHQSSSSSSPSSSSSSSTSTTTTTIIIDDIGDKFCCFY